MPHAGFLWWMGAGQHAGSVWLPPQRDYGIHLFFAKFADLELVIDHPAVATVGVLRLFDPGYREEVCPECVGVA
jgi:hypothetical protein